MNEKGFTLPELIGVLLILSLIALISVPTIYSTLKDSKEKSDENQKNLLISYAKVWQSENDHLISNEIGSVYNLYINDLKPYIENDKVINVKKGTEMDNACIKITTMENKYQYEFVEECD